MLLSERILNLVATTAQFSIAEKFAFFLAGFDGFR